MTDSSTCTEVSGKKGKFFLEKNVRLSQSLLWKLQQNFFTRQGVNAWRKGIVPHYLTSNPFTANAYAEVVKGYLDDCLVSGQLDATQPIYIIELGTGSGRFSFHFLKRFFKDENNHYRNIGIKYIMSDFTQSNLDFWDQHEQLQPYVDKAMLDFALFDLEKDTEFQLIKSGDRLNSGTLSNPAVFIANYVFDGVAQDLFEIKDGKLYECLVSLSTEEEIQDADDPALIGKLIIDYTDKECSADYYKNDGWNTILVEYTKTFRNTNFLFPISGFTCFDALRRMTNNRLLLLSADKGYSNAEELDGKGRPSVVKHGSFSLSVNYHALKRHAELEGGTVLHKQHPPYGFEVIGLVWCNHEPIFLKQAYETYVENLSPISFYHLIKASTRGMTCLSFDEIASLLQISLWDAKILCDCYKRLIYLLPQTHGKKRRYFREIFGHVLDNYFRLNEEPNPVFYIGTLLARMHEYRDALSIYEQVQSRCGYTSNTEFNIGVAYLNLDDLEKASSHIQNVCAVDTGLEYARRLFNKIRLLMNLRDKNYIDDLLKKADEDYSTSTLSHYAANKQNSFKSAISLTPLQAAHIERVYQYATPEIMRLINCPCFRNKEEAREWLHNEISDIARYSFSIAHRAEGVIGVVSLHKIDDETGEFLFWIGKPFWDKGYGTAALSQFLIIVFGCLGISEIKTAVSHDNKRSIHIVEKIGFNECQIIERMRHYTYEKQKML